MGKERAKKRKIIIVLLALLGIAVLSIVGTMAYFSNTATFKSVFVIGDGVEIELTEPLWQQDYPNGVAEFSDPGQVIRKDPTVNNLGSDCWVRFKLELKDANGNMITGNQANDIWSLIDDWNSEFVLDSNYSDSDNGIRYYNYTKILKQGANPQTLFEKIEIPSSWTMSRIENLGTFKIMVYAQAIQTAGFENNPAGAFEELQTFEN